MARYVTMVGAGDIAYCGGDRDKATANLLGNIRGTVFTLGDNAYDRGIRSEFRNCYDPTWGKYKQRARPAVGNHDYYTSDARPYYDYFGARAGRPSRGYYAYDKGSWHIVVLNSNCGKVGCSPGSRQAQWLRQNLENNRSRCTLAYWHHPLFASNASTGSVRPFWEILYNRNADIVLSGHAHSYERFAPQTPGGRRNDARGIREFVVGTGGKPASTSSNRGPPTARSATTGRPACSVSISGPVLTPGSSFMSRVRPSRTRARIAVISRKVFRHRKFRLPSTFRDFPAFQSQPRTAAQ